MEARLAGRAGAEPANGEGAAASGANASTVVATVESEAEAVAANAAAAKAGEGEVGAPVEGGGNNPDETNVWPDEAAESAFLGEARERGENPVAAATTAASATKAGRSEETRTKALPALDDLVQRIPAEARELLDDLFRARFTSVRRVKPGELKG